MVERARGASGRGWCLVLTVVWLMGAAIPAGAWDRVSPPITPSALDALARQYRDADLPLPPPDAPLMLISSGYAETVGRATVPLCVVAFETKPPPGPGVPGTFLAGTQEFETTSGDPASVPPPLRLGSTQGLPTGVRLYVGSLRNDPYPVNDWLALAIQFHLRGDDRLAEQIFARGLARDEKTENRFTPIGDGGPRDSLAATAWNYWMNVLCTADTDRRAVLTHLEKLAAGFPVLDGPVQRDYLASLRLALVPGKSVPGSVEAAVDALVDFAGDSNFGYAAGPDYVHLQLLGFEAVPTLLAHLDDRRLTRSVTARNVDPPSAPLRVGDLANGLIGDIAGAGAFPDAGSMLPEEQPIKREDAERWWARASGMGEEAYMTGGLQPPTEVNLRIVSEKYPQRLGEMYMRRLKETPEADCQSLAEAISECARLAPAERRRLLRAGAESTNLRRVLEAIGVLAGLDRAEADAVLLENLAHWPTTVTGPYDQTRPEALVSSLVLQSDSAAVWEACERALWRADVSLRMQMLYCLSAEGVLTAKSVRQLAVLDLFLDDEEERVIRKEDEAPGGKYEGCPMTPETRRLSVRNHVAQLLGNMLDFKPPPGPKYTERWWAKYRADARAAIERQARASLETPVERASEVARFEML